MTTQKLIVFKHIGTDTNEEQRRQQAMLGCAPAQKLFNLVKITKKTDLPPRSFSDYSIELRSDECPAGVEMIEMI